MLSFITTVSSTVAIRFFTFLHGEKVGSDAAGNRYYRGKPRRGSKAERRWVLYNGPQDASLVPPEWHGWLHHQSNLVPTENNTQRHHWQKPHQPNPTGTAQAIFPPGHAHGGDQRAKATGDYQPWTPPQHS